MSDFIKWGILAVLIVSVVLLIVGSGAWGAITGIFTDSGVAQIIEDGIGAMASFLIIGRMLLNNFFYPPLLSAVIILSFSMFTIYTVIRVATFIGRFIYK